MIHYVKQMSRQNNENITRTLSATGINKRKSKNSNLVSMNRKLMLNSHCLNRRMNEKLRKDVKRTFFRQSKLKRDVTKRHFNITHAWTWYIDEKTPSKYDK